MTNEHRPQVSRLLRRVIGATGPDGLTDTQLLERFVTHRDEAAFEVLVWRHGPMVRGVCRRILRLEQDAEDAFQATFLVLARKAASIGNGRAVAGWLHRVAHRVAVRAKGLVGKRAERETSLTDVPAIERIPEVVWSDLRPVLDEEVNRLPEKYRTPFILCYLGGRTNAEAARELCCPHGTVLSRLAWARERLRMRLVRRGVTLSAGAVGALTPLAAEAALPSTLVSSIATAAARIAVGESVAGVATAPVVALTQGVLQTMRWTPITLVAGCLLAAGTVGVGGLLLWPTPDATLRAEEPPKAEKQERPPAKQPEKTYAFEMREKPWSAVLEWYADASGLAFVSFIKVPGTFTFVGPRDRKYTLSEIFDLMNEALQAQKYLLIRRATSFTAVSTEEKIDPAVVQQVRADDLEKRGRTELVRLSLPLTTLKAADIAPDIKKLLGPFGEVVVLEKANQLMVQDTVANLRRILQMVKDVENRKAPPAK